MIRTCVAFQTRASALPEGTVRAVRDTAFEQHVRNDHQPWRRDCEHCVAGGLQGRLHKRVSCPEGYALSLDLLGRYEPAPSELHKTVSLVGCFVVPQLSVRQGDSRGDGHEDTASPAPPPKVVDPNPSSRVDPPASLVVEPSTSYRVLDPNSNTPSLPADPSNLAIGMMMIWMAMRPQTVMRQHLRFLSRQCAPILLDRCCPRMIRTQRPLCSRNGSVRSLTSS